MYAVRKAGIWHYVSVQTIEKKKKERSRHDSKIFQQTVVLKIWQKQRKKLTWLVWISCTWLQIWQKQRKNWLDLYEFPVHDYTQEQNRSPYVFPSYNDAKRRQEKIFKILRTFAAMVTWRSTSLYRTLCKRSWLDGIPQKEVIEEDKQRGLLR